MANEVVESSFRAHHLSRPDLHASAQGAMESFCLVFRHAFVGALV